MPHRCAFGCKNTNSGVVMHMFPNPKRFPEHFHAWVSLLGGKFGRLSDHEIYLRKRICDIHFTDAHKNRYKRLNALAMPTLYLPGNIGKITKIANSGISGSEPAIPAVIPPLHDTNTGEPNHIPSTAAVLSEHNYSAISRTSRNMLSKAVPLNYQCMQMKPLHYKMKIMRNKICCLRKKVQCFKERFAATQKLCNNVAFRHVTKNMTKAAQLFAHMQLQSTKKPKGRRFSMEEKVLSASLFKKSPKCYRLLCKYFALPSSKSMKRLLGQIKLTPGINKIIFKKIKETVREKEVSDRLCTLIFDEMSITPQIMYNAQKDTLEGFASNKESAFADHVLVFMVKGVISNFKQPVAYYFTNSLNKITLKNIIKSVIEHTLETGLIITSTVCDQSPVNVGAITELINETRASYFWRNKNWNKDMFRVKNQNIIPLYDTPHLIKGIRNNIITKDLIYTIDGQEKIIKWEYFQLVYNADKSYKELRLLNKLTEAHVIPEKINKMRVKSATQLFSHSVAVVTEHLTARGDLPNECRQLIDFILLLDNLFDSLNVSSLSVENGKIYKGSIKRNSPHHQLWQKAKEILKTTKYIKKVRFGDKTRLTETIAPSITNLIKTVEGIESLWKLLSRKYGIDAMLTRNFNQDPIENFFGNIRSYGVRNIAPNTVSFEGALKALMINNYSEPHSSGANCEEDHNECLQSLDFFLKDKNIITPDIPDTNDTIHFNSEICFDQSNEIDAGQSNYVCGWVLKRCLKFIIKGCQHCKQTLFENDISNDNNSYIYAKEYMNKNGCAILIKKWNRISKKSRI
ncbi:unnamed protein product, partial [Brenthis ino]